MRVGFLIVGLLFVAVPAAGCAAGGDGGIVSGEDSEGRMALYNTSSRDAWYAFTRQCGAAVWGEDELGPAVVVHPGQSAAWRERVGCYDLLVLSNPRVAPRFEARYPQQLVAPGRQTGVTLADQDWTPLAVDAYPPGPSP